MDSQPKRRVPLQMLGARKRQSRRPPLMCQRRPLRLGCPRRRPNNKRIQRLPLSITSRARSRSRSTSSLSQSCCSLIQSSSRDVCRSWSFSVRNFPVRSIRSRIGTKSGWDVVCLTQDIQRKLTGHARDSRLTRQRFSASYATDSSDGFRVTSDIWPLSRGQRISA